MVDADTLKGWLEAAVSLAGVAGRAILDIAHEDINVRDKADGTPLTRADETSHQIIQAGLEKLRTNLPIISEEGELEAILADAPETYWIVDPLDGTKEFVKGLGDYTVNIAVVDAGQPVLGVVYIPEARTTYYAANGRGAMRRLDGQAPEPISPSSSTRPASAVVSRSHLSDETRQFLDVIGVTETIQRGSSVKMTAVADGSADVYPRHGPTCLWDTAAGTAVCRAAGCRVTDLELGDLSYRLSEGIKRPGFLVFPAEMERCLREASDDTLLQDEDEK